MDGRAAASPVSRPAGGSVVAANGTRLPPQARAPPPSLQELADQWRLTPEQAAALGKPEMAGRMRICVAPYTPYIFCDAKQPQEGYTGYYVELFRALAQRVGWLSDFESWFIDCVDWTPIMADLMSPNGTCMLAPAGVSASDELFASGASISWVTDKEGVRIMTVPGNRDTNLWAPLSVFSAPLWLLIFCTSVFVGGVLWIFDQRARSLLRPAWKRGRPASRAAARPRLTAFFRRRRGTASIAGAPDTHDTGAEATGGDVVLVGGLGGGGGCAAVAGSGAVGSTGAAREDMESGNSGAPEKLGRGTAVGWQHGNHLHEQKPPHQRGWMCGLLSCLGVQEGEEAAAMNDLRDSMVQSVLRLPDIGDGLAVRTLPARIVLFAYGLLLLIIVALYTANSAALLTARLNSDIRGIGDLRGKSVGVWEDLDDRMAALGITAISLPWENTEDEQAMLDKLRSGQIKALIMSTSFVDWVVAQQCEFAAVEDQFVVMDYAVGYQRHLSPQLRQSVDRSLAMMIEQGIVEKLYNINVKKQGGACQADLRTAAEMAQVTPSQVAGLWVLLGLSIALGAGVLCAYALHRHAKHVRKHAGRLLSASRTKSRSHMVEGAGGCKQGVA